MDTYKEDLPHIIFKDIEIVSGFTKGCCDDDSKPINTMVTIHYLRETNESGKQEDQAEVKTVRMRIRISTDPRKLIEKVILESSLALLEKYGVQPEVVDSIRKYVYQMTGLEIIDIFSPTEPMNDDDLSQNRDSYPIDGSEFTRHSRIDPRNNDDLPQNRYLYEGDGSESTDLSSQFNPSVGIDKKFSVKNNTSPSHNPGQVCVSTQTEDGQPFNGEQYTHADFERLRSASQNERKVKEKSSGDYFLLERFNTKGYEKNESGKNGGDNEKYVYHCSKQPKDVSVPVRKVPGERDSTSSGDNTNIETHTSGEVSRSSQPSAFVNFWRLEFNEDSRELVRLAQTELLKTESDVQSTMFLLDTSESMKEGAIETMKTVVQDILNDAETARIAEAQRNAKQAFGMAIFGRDTKIIHVPTTDYSSIVNSLGSIRTCGRSPLGLGLIVCTSIWFGNQGLQGTVWIEGRKVYPKIILVTDMKPNETVRYQRFQEYENDDLENISQVFGELYSIAVGLRNMNIPVFLIPVGKNNEDFRNRFENSIKMTGGHVIDPNDNVHVHLLGRLAWHERIACVAMKHLADNPMLQGEEHCTGLVRTMMPFGDEEDKREVARKVTNRLHYERNGTFPEAVQLHILGEPGEQWWGDFPLGTRVTKTERQLQPLTGTVIAHAPNLHFVVSWDREGMVDCFKSDELKSVQLYRNPQKIANTPIRLRIGCKVRRVTENTPSVEGTVIGVATLQNNVLYVIWSDGNIGRHLYPDQIKECEAFTWTCNFEGRSLQLSPDNIDALEDAYRREKKTKVITIQSKQYRAMFQRKKIRQLFEPNYELDLIRDPEY